MKISKLYYVAISTKKLLKVEDAHEGTYLCYGVGIDGIGHDLYFSKTTGVFLRKQLTLKSTYKPKTLHLMPKFFLHC